MTEKLVRVYPLPLPPGNFLAGVGEDGADVSPELAAEWLKAGLVTKSKPDAPALAEESE